MSGGGAMDAHTSPEKQLLQFLQPYVAHWQRSTGAAQSGQAFAEPFVTTVTHAAASAEQQTC